MRYILTTFFIVAGLIVVFLILGFMSKYIMNYFGSKSVRIETKSRQKICENLKDVAFSYILRIYGSNSSRYVKHIFVNSYYKGKKEYFYIEMLLRDIEASEVFYHQILLDSPKVGHLDTPLIGYLTLEREGSNSFVLEESTAFESFVDYHLKGKSNIVGENIQEYKATIITDMDKLIEYEMVQKELSLVKRKAILIDDIETYISKIVSLSNSCGDIDILVSTSELSEILNDYKTVISESKKIDDFNQILTYLKNIHKYLDDFVKKQKTKRLSEDEELSIQNTIDKEIKKVEDIYSTHLKARK